MKRLVTAFLVLLAGTIHAQTIFRYGNDSVSLNEFLKAYHKNNTGPKTEQAFRDYLDLYISSRLKIREARDKGYDTLPQLVVDLDNLRQQILPSYTNDKQAVDRLVEEARQRAQKDIHIAHIFISFTQRGVVDTVTAAKKLNEVLQQLKAHPNFPEAARLYSDDPSAPVNGGDLNWITAFTLPYALENLAYNTPQGQVSAVYRSRAGYHIFKNLGERKDPGRMKAAEILFAFPAGSDEAAKAHIKQLADSIYGRLQKGDDFGKLATQFSNDVVSSAANGQMQEFGVGQYDPGFEAEVFALPRDGAFTQPFLTSHGYHIVKRLSITPPPARNNAKAMQTLREKVESNDRMSTTRTAIANRVLGSSVYQKYPFSEAELWAFSDSILNYRTPSIPLHMNLRSVLFNLGGKKVNAADWISYAQTFRYKSDGSGVKPYPQIWDEFLESSAIDYYQMHLEEYNPEFRQQLTEFKEGNLFFEIMQRQVWGPAQTDSTALLAYYNSHRSKYNWTRSADAVIFYVSDVPSAKIFAGELKKDPASWHTLVTNFSEKVAADSARFEWKQIPNPSGQLLKPGVVTTPLINKNDNTASFAYVLRVYQQPAPRSFQEAKGLVINDYQSELEKNWVTALKKKYPVAVNAKLVDEIIRDKKW